MNLRPGTEQEAIELYKSSSADGEWAPEPGQPIWVVEDGDGTPVTFASELPAMTGCIFVDQFWIRYIFGSPSRDGMRGAIVLKDFYKQRAKTEHKDVVGFIHKSNRDWAQKTRKRKAELLGLVFKMFDKD